MACSGLRLSSRMVTPIAPRCTRSVAKMADPFLEGNTRTTIENLDYKGNRPVVISYNPSGFIISRQRVFGPACILPDCILQWKIMRKEDITAESLVIFNLYYPRLEMLFLGLGDRVSRLDPRVKERLLQSGISVDAMDTPNAIAAYNYLVAEGRPVAAALIPVTRT